MADFVNDPTIPDEAELWRRIPLQWIKRDEALGRLRPSSQAFQDSRDGSPMSAFLASMFSGPEAILSGHQGYYVVALSAGFVREIGLGVSREPIRDQDPAGHVWVVGKKTGSIRSQMANAAKWVGDPPDRP